MWGHAPQTQDHPQSGKTFDCNKFATPALSFHHAAPVLRISHLSLCYPSVDGKCCGMRQLLCAGWASTFCLSCVTVQVGAAREGLAGHGCRLDVICGACQQHEHPLAAAIAPYPMLSYCTLLTRVAAMQMATSGRFVNASTALCGFPVLSLTHLTAVHMMTSTSASCASTQCITSMLFQCFRSGCCRITWPDGRARAGH